MWVVPQNLQLGMPQALQPRQPYGSDPQSEHLWQKTTCTGTIRQTLSPSPGVCHRGLALATSVRTGRVCRAWGVSWVGVAAAVHRNIG